MAAQRLHLFPLGESVEALLFNGAEGGAVSFQMTLVCVSSQGSELLLSIELIEL